MALPLFIVDAFTREAFQGNPAAVCLLDAPLPGVAMQAIAAEMNLSETAFLLRDEDAFHLRWFTPRVEVDLCGHATLAAAHVLWESGALPRDQPAQFRTKSGPLMCSLRPGAVPEDTWVEMDFPAEPAIPVADGAALLAALGLPRVAGAPCKNRFDYLVELGDEEAVRAFTPDLAAIARLSARGVIITAHSRSAGYHFVSRFFAPSVGVPEDPVTGSAHCALAPYWSEKLHTHELTGYQASARGGIVRMHMASPTAARVTLSGQAVTVVKGQCTAPLPTDILTT